MDSWRFWQPPRHQGKQDISGFKLSTHSFNELQIHTVIEQITVKGIMGLIPNTVNSSPLLPFHMHVIPTCIATFSMPSRSPN